MLVFNKGPYRDPNGSHPVEFPAIFPDTDNPLWPEFWSKEELLSVKASLPGMKWNAQWMQTPTAEEGSIIKREWWNEWEHDTLPGVQYIIQSYDTAFSKKQSADFSAISTWGVFRPSDGAPDSIILLDCQKGRWDFPELKEKAMKDKEEELKAMKKKEAMMKRKAQLEEVGLDAESASATMEDFADVDDETFDKVVALMKKKAEMPDFIKKKMEEKKSALSLNVNSPFDGSLIKIVKMQAAEDAKIMLEKAALLFKNREVWKENHERIAILNKLALLVKEEAEDFGQCPAGESDQAIER